MIFVLVELGTKLSKSIWKQISELSSPKLSVPLALQLHKYKDTSFRVSYRKKKCGEESALFTSSGTISWKKQFSSWAHLAFQPHVMWQLRQVITTETQLWKRILSLHVSSTEMRLLSLLLRFTGDKHTSKFSFFNFPEHIHGIPGLQKASN